MCVGEVSECGGKRVIMVSEVGCVGGWGGGGR